MNELIPMERIESKIYLIRKQKVMLDFDLSDLYGVETKVLNQAVKRNSRRFPEDFMFSLSKQEIQRMSQIVTSSNIKFHKNVNAFTEQGVAMLSTVLNSQKAMEINILIMRAFVKLRQVLSTNKDLSYLFRELKGKVDRHDAEIGEIIKAIEQMIAYEKEPKAKIGFKV